MNVGRPGKEITIFEKNLGRSWEARTRNKELIVLNSGMVHGREARKRFNPSIGVDFREGRMLGAGQLGEGHGLAGASRSTTATHGTVWTTGGRREFQGVTQ